jgi:hypothetical protein
MYVYYNNVNSIWAAVQRLQVNSSHLSALGAFLFIWNVILQCKPVLTVAPLLLQNLLRKVTINTLAHSNENTGFF